MSFPERGNYGKSSWRGNTSGYVIKELIQHFDPKIFVDACEGSGTSADVCKEMGVPYTSFLKWKNGYLLYTEANLSKIEAFLNNHNE